MISHLLLIILALVLCERRQSSYVVTDDGEVMVQLGWRSKKNPNATLHFTFYLYEEHMDAYVWNYCELKTIGTHYCSKLFAYIQKLQQSLIHDQQQRLAKHSHYDIDIAEQNDDYQHFLSNQRNKHLIRHRRVLAMEMEQRYRTKLISGNSNNHVHVGDVLAKYQHQINIMQYIDQAVVQVIWKMFTRYFHDSRRSNNNDDADMPMERIAFIHSESYDDGIEVEDENVDYPTTNKRELDIILNELDIHGLLHELDEVIVLHYGPTVSKSLISRYPNVTFIHVSSDTSFGQIPSLRIIRAVAKLLSQEKDLHYNTNSIHVLYMRTLGTEYTSIHQQIEDWRSLLLYFMVEKHLLCFELLESNVMDVVTVNYISKPNQRSLYGNYWWSTVGFLTRLLEIPYEALDPVSITSGWLFSTPVLRIHTLHNSYLNHEMSPYPRYCYSNTLLSGENAAILSYKHYKKSCGQGATLEYYALIHNATALNDFPLYSKELHQNDNSREITDFCSSYEVVSVFDS